MSRVDAMPRRDEIPPGTLYMLILRTLSRGGEMHGFEIANSIQQISDSAGGGRITVPGAPEDAYKRLGHGGMGRYGWESPRALLQVDKSRTQPVRSRAVTVPACEPGHHTRDSNGVKGGS